MSTPSLLPNRPSLFWYVTEPGRALTEFGLSYSYTNLNKQKKSGDGHPVLVIPGFMGSESSTVFLRGFIQKLGYEVYDWGLGRNLGRVEDIDVLVEKVEKISAHHQKPVSLIGWSLGGVFARQVAKQNPALVRQVITLGSPFRNVVASNNATWLYTALFGSQKVKDLNHTVLNTFPTPAPLPTTAVYTKEDGIVPWETCMEMQEDEFHQNIQVRGSHCGLGMNSSVLHIIEDRLKYSMNNWTHFKPQGILKSKLLYPSL